VSHSIAPLYLTSCNNGLEQRKSLTVAIRFLRLQDAAESRQRRAACRIWRHPARTVVGDRHLEVRASSSASSRSSRRR
jgi:hypothetical protein